MHERRKQTRGLVRLLRGAAAALALGMVLPMATSYAFADATAVDAPVSTNSLTVSGQSGAVSLQTHAKKNGWVSTTYGKKYYRAGKPVKHLVKIGSSYYYFDANGIMQTRDVELNGVQLYIMLNGRVLGAKYKGAFYYKDLKRMSARDAKEFRLLLEAHKVIGSICDEGDSLSAMRRKAFDWVVSQRYRGEHRLRGVSREEWIMYQAQKMFEGEGGNCHGAGSSFAYLLAAIGEHPLYMVDALRNDTMHAWVELRGKRYDPVYAQWRGYANYYAADGRGNFDSDGNWVEYRPVETYSIPWLSSANAKKGAKVPAAIRDIAKDGIESDGEAITLYEDGKRVRSAWRTIGKDRYYFDKNGEAVTGSAKIRGTHYVFDAKGALSRSSKAGTHTVKVEGETYRADKEGKAASGWSASKKRYFTKSGKMLANVWKTIGGVRYFFKADGVKATGPTRIAKAYYLFGKNGGLMRGTAGDGSLVRLGSNTYRVDDRGRALSGWSADRTQRFAKNGRLLKGICLVPGKLYAADKAGTYLPELTSQLQAAGVKGARATDLRRLLGKPDDELYSASCNFNGDDGVWEYESFRVFTARPKAVGKRFATIEAAIAAEDAAGAGGLAGEFESIVSVSAK